MDIIGKRFWFYLISLMILVPGIVFLIISPGLKPGIEFTGGSTLDLEFAEPVTQAQLRSELAKLGYSESTIQKAGENSYFIRTVELNETAKNGLVRDLTLSLSPKGIKVLSFDLVSPLVARRTIMASFWAVLAASIGIFIYLWWAFRSVPNPVRFCTAAIIVLLHDIMVVIGIFAILGKLINMEVGTLFLIGILTVIGYSVNDTIVVFDRLRENVLLYPNRKLRDNANRSVLESLGRSMNTGWTTIIVLLTLLLFGGVTIRPFILVMLIGILSGTFSSIGIASSILVTWEEGDIGRFFGRIFRRKATPKPSAV